MNLSLKRLGDNVLKKFKLVLLGQPAITLNCYFNCELDCFLVLMPIIENEKNLVFVATVFLEIKPETGEKFFTFKNRKKFKEVFLKNTYELLRLALLELGFQDTNLNKAKMSRTAKRSPEKITMPPVKNPSATTKEDPHILPFTFFSPNKRESSF